MRLPIQYSGVMRKVIQTQIPSVRTIKMIKASRVNNRLAGGPRKIGLSGLSRSPSAGCSTDTTIPIPFTPIDVIVGDPCVCACVGNWCVCTDACKS